MESALFHFDSKRYRLLAWCIMPNHVHVVLETTPSYGLGSIIHSWKGFTASLANERLGRSGPFWHPDYFDRFMRSERHLCDVVAYVEANPVKAGLVSVAGHWRWSSASRRVT